MLKSIDGIPADEILSASPDDIARSFIEDFTVAVPKLLTEKITVDHPSVRGCVRSPDGTSTSPEADPPVVDVSDHGVTIIRPHRRSRR